ncbi:MAG TPA: antibiotic biosynthesis monooxygenase, partial [Anaerolineales bacterium]|nr:antibiotic biosynthesis monooxygenase [Anaerolineales bacterium]
MVITILEAVVERDRIGELENAYRRETGAIPPEIVETFLARDAGDETKFRIITIWRDRQALESMRASVEKPKGVQIFEEAGAAPTLTIL